MKNCSLIKYTPGYSNHALSLHGYLFLDEAIKKLEREGLFLDVDYSYTIKYLNREIMTLFLTYSPRHESTIKSILDIKLSPTDEAIQRKIGKLEIETRKEFAYDLQQVKNNLQAIQNHEWSTFEDFSFYKETRLSTPKELLFNEIGEATLYTKFIAMRLKGSYLEENSHAPLLYTLLAGPIAMQIVHILQREYSSSISMKDTFEPKHLLKLMHITTRNDESTEKMSERIEKGLGDLDSEMLFKNIHSYVHKNNFMPTRYELIPHVLFQNTRSIAGIEDWKKFTTVANMKELLNHTTLHIGDLGKEFVFDRTVDRILTD